MITEFNFSDTGILSRNNLPVASIGTLGVKTHINNLDHFTEQNDLNYKPILNINTSTMDINKINHELYLLLKKNNIYIHTLYSIDNMHFFGMGFLVFRNN